MCKFNSLKVEAKFTDDCLLLVIYDYKLFPFGLKLQQNA